MKEFALSQMLSFRQAFDLPRDEDCLKNDTAVIEALEAVFRKEG